MTDLAPKDYFYSTFHANKFRDEIQDISNVWQNVLSWGPLRLLSNICYQGYLLCIVSPLLWFYLNGPNVNFFGWSVGGWAGKSYPDICAMMNPKADPRTWTSSPAMMEECSLMVFREFHAFVAGLLSLVYIGSLVLIFYCLSRTLRNATWGRNGEIRNRPLANNDFGEVKNNSFFLYQINDFGEIRNRRFDNNEYVGTRQDIPWYGNATPNQQRRRSSSNALHLRRSLSREFPNSSNIGNNNNEFVNSNNSPIMTTLHLSRHKSHSRQSYHRHSEGEHRKRPLIGSKEYQSSSSSSSNDNLLGVDLGPSEKTDVIGKIPITDI